MIRQLIVAIAALFAIGAALRGQDAAKKPLVRSARHSREAPATFKVDVRHERRHVRRRRDRAWAPIGADPLLQPREERLLRRRAVLPRRSRTSWCSSASTPIRRCRPRSRTRIKDDPVEGEQQEGLRHLRADLRRRTRARRQFFINFKDNAFLDRQGFAPFGEVTSGMDVGREDHRQARRETEPGRIQSQGNAYLTKEFPKLDYIKTATIEK